MDVFPVIVIELIARFSPFFGANNYLYFQGFMLAYMLLGQTRKSVTRVAMGCFFLNRHISNWERFLSKSQWNLCEIQKYLVSLIIEKLRHRMLVHGALLGWLDTSLVSKVKGKMPGVQKWHDHSGNPDHGDKLIGHHFALAGLVGFGIYGQTSLCFPIIVNLISGQLNPLGFVVNALGEAQLMTFWNIVCPMIAQLQFMVQGLPIRIVVDAYFSKAPFITQILLLRIHIISRMRHDAVGWDDPEPVVTNGKKRSGRKPKHVSKGKKWKIAELLTNFPTEIVEALIYGRARRVIVVCRDLWITGVESQKIRVVVIKAKGKPVILLSTDLTLSAKQIIEIYGLRFPAELAIRDLKQHFGLGDYQCTSLLSIIRYVGLSLIGFCLWRLTLLDDSDAEWLQIPNKTTALSFTRISRSLRSYVMKKIFQKSALNADLNNSQEFPAEVLQMII